MQLIENFLVSILDKLKILLVYMHNISYIG